MANLILHLKKEYFDEIKAGNKLVEYREATEYWSKRLVGRKYDNVVLLCGYPALEDKEKTIVRKYRGYTRETLSLPVYGGLVEVFAIDIRRSENDPH